MADEKPSINRPWRLDRLWGLLGAAGVLVAAANVLGLIGSSFWLFELATHFRVQYVLGLSVIAGLLWPVGQRRLAIGLAVLVWIDVMTIAPLYFGASPPTQTAQAPIRIMLLNVNTRTGDPARVAAVIAQANPDLLVLEEIDRRWIDALQVALASYPHTLTRPRNDHFGIGLFSKLPMEEARLERFGDAGVPSITARVQMNDRWCRVIATHPLPPVNAKNFAARNTQLDAIASYAREAQEPVLLIGDLNASPWSPAFGRLLSDAGLKNSAQGWGIQPSWPTFNPLFWIPIDHVLHSPSIQILDRRIGPKTGSDHYPVMVDCQVVPAGMPIP